MGRSTVPTATIEPSGWIAIDSAKAAGEVPNRVTATPSPENVTSGVPRRVSWIAPNS